MEEKSDKVEKEEKEKEEKEAPKLPFFTYMMMYPQPTLYGVDNKKDEKPSMVYMIPVYCVDPNNLPNGMTLPTMPTMPQMFPMPPFYSFQPFGMPMAHK